MQLPSQGETPQIFQFQPLSNRELQRAERKYRPVQYFSRQTAYCKYYWYQAFHRISTTPSADQTVQLRLRQILGHLPSSYRTAHAPSPPTLLKKEARTLARNRHGVRSATKNVYATTYPPNPKYGSLHLGPEQILCVCIRYLPHGIWDVVH